MDLDVHDTAARGLRHYLTLVAQSVGVGAEACSIHFDLPIGAYLTAEQRLPNFPHRDVALLWDETHGWALAIETHSGADLVVLGYLAGDILPPPHEVADYLQRAVAGAGAGQPHPPALCTGQLRTWLAGYAEPVTVQLF